MDNERRTIGMGSMERRAEGESLPTLIEIRDVPTRMFSNVDRAVEWIRQQLESARDA